jgi:dihydrofolate reductase
MALNTTNTSGTDVGRTTMRKLIESTLVSLDGVTEAPERWANFDDEAKHLALANLGGYDAFVMGRTTFENFHRAWSPIRGDDYLDAINTSRKYVISTTLGDVGWNAKVLNGDAATEVAKLKSQPGNPLIKYGTGRLSRTLADHGLIDEFQFWIFPVRAGQGKRLFEYFDKGAPELHLTSTHTLRSGVVILTYAVNSSPG